jgi:glutamate synthase (NADPH/NADH) large chain
VVEGVGDHACEYMTGGRVIVLGETGKNFAAGMSGGIAYVLDENKTFDEHCNKSMVGLDPLLEEDISFVKELIEQHLQLTGSAKAEKILKNFDQYVLQFVKVIPHDYKRVMAEKKQKEQNKVPEKIVA